MNLGTERRLARIEGKLNIITRAIIWLLALVVGFSVYFFSLPQEWAPYYGFGAAVAAGGIVEMQIRGLEKTLPYIEDD